MIRTFIMGCLGLVAAALSLIIQQNYLLAILFALGGLFLFSVCIVKALMKEMLDEQKKAEVREPLLTDIRYSVNKNYKSSAAELKAIHEILINNEYAHLN